MLVKVRVNVADLIVTEISIMNEDVCHMCRQFSQLVILHPEIIKTGLGGYWRQFANLVVVTVKIGQRRYKYRWM